MTSDALRQPLVLPAETLPNRVAKAGLAECLAEIQGAPTARHVRLYEAWARGGAGVIITGAATVDRRHAASYGAVAAEAMTGPLAGRFSDWAQAGRRRGAGFWLQLSHAGARTHPGINAAPLTAWVAEGETRARAMSAAEIAEVVDRFAAAARAAKAAGFTGVEIEASHGMLLAQFLSPQNRRRDEWGGAVENRARLVLEVVRRVREACGADFTIWASIDVVDRPAEAAALAGWLQAAGADGLECVGGDYRAPAAIGGRRVNPASAIARAVRAPLMVTGCFRNGAAIRAAVASQGFALVGVGRPFATDPLVPAKLFAGQGELERWEDRLRAPLQLEFRSQWPFVRRRRPPSPKLWYAAQLRRMGDGLAPDPQLSLVDADRDQKEIEAAWLAAFHANGGAS